MIENNDNDKITDNLLTKGNIIINGPLHVGDNLIVSKQGTEESKSSHLIKEILNPNSISNKIVKCAVVTTIPFLTPKIVDKVVRKIVYNEPLIKLPHLEKQKLLEETRDSQTGILTLYYQQKDNVTPLTDFALSVLEDGETIDVFDYIFKTENKLVKFFKPYLEKSKTQLEYTEYKNINKSGYRAIYIITKENNKIRARIKLYVISKDCLNNDTKENNENIIEVPDDRIEIIEWNKKR